MSPAFGSLLGALLRPCPGRLRVPPHVLAPKILQLSQQPQHGCPASFSERAVSALGGEWGAISRSLRLLPASLQPFHLLRMGVQWKGWFSNCALEPKGLQVCGARRGETGRGQRHHPQVSWRGWVCVRVAPALSHLRKPSLASVAMGPQGLWKGLQPTRGPAETGADKGVEQASEAASPSVVPAPTASSWVAPPSRGQSWHRQSGAWGACVPCTPRC